MSHGKGLLIFFALLAVVLIALKPHTAALLRAQSDDVTMVSDDDPLMLAAFAKARNTLDHFLTLSAAPTPNTESYAVKVAVREGDRTEYFWIVPFARAGETFSGRVSNTPRYVATVSEGQEIQFQRSDIVDWSYENRVEQRTYGNFTACALLARESAEEAAAVKKEYGLECDG